jgi:hypothetical protein
VSTVDCGAWVAASDGAAACERRRARRYWHHGLEVAENTEEETVRWPSTLR